MNMLLSLSEKCLILKLSATRNHCEVFSIFLTTEFFAFDVLGKKDQLSIVLIKMSEFIL